MGFKNNFALGLGRVYYAGVAALFFVCIFLFATGTHITESILAGIALYFWIELYSNNTFLERLTAFKAFLLSFGSRLLFVTFVSDKIVQTSDFEITLKNASSGAFTDNLEYYRNWVHKLIYPMILHAFKFTSSKRIFFLQCTIIGFVGVMVYLLAKRLIGQRGGAIAAMLYVLWPGQIIYASMITEEHVAALLTLILVYMMFGFYEDLKGEFKDRKSYVVFGLKVVLAGVLFGFSTVFKDWGAVILVATIISAIWVMIDLGCLKKAGIIVLTLAILVGVRSGVSSMILGYAGHKLGAEVSNNVVVSSMYGTLDPDSTGEFSKQGDEEYFEIVRNNNYDYKAANKEAFTILWDKIKAKPGKMPALLLRKGRTSYTDDGSMLYWAFVMNAKNQETYDMYRSWIQIIWYYAGFYYSLIALCLLGAIVYKVDRKKFFLALVILGGVMVNLIIESHGRYKYSIEPVWCVMAAMFLESMVSRFQKEA